MIRQACSADADAITAIWNHYILNTLVTFNSVAKSGSDVVALIETRAASGCGTLVVETGGAVTGFATYGAFRSGPGYAATVEHTILLAPQALGKGTGRALMQALIRHAAEREKHVMVAGIAAPNRAGQRFHAAMGFEKTGCMPQVGHKNGRWLDLVWMQKILENPA
ncbi:MAG: N-acetyltransferase family protein [Brevirhabdus sp.]